MEELKTCYSLVKKLNDRQSVYRVYFDILRGDDGGTVEESMGMIRLVPGWKMEYKAGNPVRLIMVSDAHTHCERLVFPAARVTNTETGESEYTRGKLSISGKMTMMIDGGDPLTIKPVGEYVYNLHMCNSKESVGE